MPITPLFQWLCLSVFVVDVIPVNFMHFPILGRKLWYLTENRSTGQWLNHQIQMCGTDLCFNGLVNRYEANILSFGEDDDGLCKL